MAVYTHISNNEVAELLSHYTIGKLRSIKGIETGIENSNFILCTSVGKFILTIYEKRVVKEDLPFYLELMEYFAQNNVPCPVPVKRGDGEYLSNIKERPCAIVTFLEGMETKQIRNNHLQEIGQHLAKMHIISDGYPHSMKNKHSLESWISLFESMHTEVDQVKKGLADEIATQLEILKRNWPTNLPQGIVHADLFPDNVFFNNQALVGIIDFYFACNDSFMYDLAICLNAWCYEAANDFNVTKAKNLLSSYNKVRPISSTELDALPILASGAAMRFLLTRIHDWINTTDGALVTPKNPLEYLNRLRFHQGITSHKEYGL